MNWSLHLLFFRIIVSLAKNVPLILCSVLFFNTDRFFHFTIYCLHINFFNLKLLIYLKTKNLKIFNQNITLWPSWHQVIICLPKEVLVQWTNKFIEGFLIWYTLENLFSLYGNGWEIFEKKAICRRMGRQRIKPVFNWFTFTLLLSSLVSSHFGNCALWPSSVYWS